MNAVSKSPGSTFSPRSSSSSIASLTSSAPPCCLPAFLFNMHCILGALQISGAIAFSLSDTWTRSKERNKPQLETGGPAPFILVVFIYPVTGAACWFNFTSCVVLEDIKQDLG